MSLRAIDNQLIVMQEAPEKPFACNNPDVCALFQSGDPLLVQMKQTPCGDNLVCNGGFDVGADLVTNGDFATDLSDWAVTSFTWSAGKAISTVDGDLTQTGLTLVNGTMYTISYDVSNYNGTTGDIQFQLGGSAPSIGSVADGHHIVTISSSNANTDLVVILTIGDGTTFAIDNITLQEVECWHAASGWLFDGSTAQHIAGFTDPLFENIYSSLSANDYVQVTYEVFGMSDGTLTVSVGGTTSRVVTENGSYIDYVITASSNDLLVFTPNTDFDGASIVTSSYELLNAADLSSAAGLYDTDDNLISVINPAIIEDFITIGFASNDLDGCYQIKVLDPCAENVNPELVTNGMFLGDPSGWTWDSINSAHPELIMVVDGYMLYESDGSGDGNNVQCVYSPAGIDYGWSGTCLFECKLRTGNVGDSFNGSTAVITISGTGGISFSGGFEPNKEYTVIGLQSQDPTDGIISVCIDGGNSSAGQTLEILSISIKHYGICDGSSTDFAPYVSNCIQVRPTIEDSMIIKGATEDADTHRKLGFYFYAAFPFLYARYKVHFLNPRRPRKTDTYLYSSGRKRGTYGQLDKTWDLTIDDTYNAFDAGYDQLAAILSMDRVYIDPSLTTTPITPEYIWEEKELSPNWDRAGKPTAECVLEISRIDKTVFN